MKTITKNNEVVIIDHQAMSVIIEVCSVVSKIRFPICTAMITIDHDGSISSSLVLAPHADFTSSTGFVDVACRAAAIAWLLRASYPQIAPQAFVHALSQTIADHMDVTGVAHQTR